MLDWLTWTPAGLFLATVVILTTPFLGLIAFLALVLGAVALLVRLAIATPHLLGRFVHRLRHERSGAARQRTVIAVAPRHATQFVDRGVRPAPPAPQ